MIRPYYYNSSRWEASYKCKTGIISLSNLLTCELDLCPNDGLRSSVITSNIRLKITSRKGNNEFVT